MAPGNYEYIFQIEKGLPPLEFLLSDVSSSLRPASHTFHSKGNTTKTGEILMRATSDLIEISLGTLKLPISAGRSKSKIS